MIFRDPNTLSKMEKVVGSVSAIVRTGDSLDVCGYVEPALIERYGFNAIIFLDGADRFVKGAELSSDGNWITSIQSSNIGQDNSCLTVQAYAASDLSSFVYPLNIDAATLRAYSEFVTGLLPPDRKDVPSFRNQYRDLIVQATKVPYVARSIFQSIQTGNNYQTINFGQSLRKGGRPSRENFLFQLDFRGKSVLDIGANTGENSRIARRLGASLVDGYEYDPFFVEIGRAINAVSGMTRVSLFQGDCTKPEIFQGMKYDMVLALAVWIYLQNTIVQVAGISDTLIFETHTLDHGMNYYYKGVLPHFPHAIALGYTEKPKDPHKSRLFVVFGKDRDKLDRLIKRDFLKVAPYFRNQFIEDHHHLGKDAVIRLSEGFLEKHMEMRSYAPEDYRFGARTYFEVFLAGLVQYLRNGNKVDANNLYVKFLRHSIRAGIMDQGLLEIAERDEWMIRKVANKYEDAMRIVHGEEDLVAPVEIVPKESGSMSFTSTAGKVYSCDIFDGHHRFFMCELVGTKKIHFLLHEVHTGTTPQR